MDTAEHDQSEVYREFKEQLQRSPEGWYTTSLPWKGNHPPLPTNEKGSLRRLTALQNRLLKKGLFEQYDAIIEDQKVQGIVEEAPAKPENRESYILHQEVVREAATSTKLRVVYDASAKQPQTVLYLTIVFIPDPPCRINSGKCSCNKEPTR